MAYFYAACAQCMLPFLILAVNSAWFRILHSYMLLLKLPVLMHSCMHSFLISVGATLQSWIHDGTEMLFVRWRKENTFWVSAYLYRVWEFFDSIIICFLHPLISMQQECCLWQQESNQRRYSCCLPWVLHNCLPWILRNCHSDTRVDDDSASKYEYRLSTHTSLKNDQRLYFESIMYSISIIHKCGLMV